VIDFIDVEKTYKSGVDALRGVSFTIEDGEFVFIIGKSGSGKSTLLKCITCEEKPTTGKVTIDNFDISHMPRALIPVLRRKIGMIYQDFRLIETKTVFENIAFAGEIIGIPKKSLAQTVQLVLNIVGLKDKADAYPQELSGGEQQRVAIARAFACDPKIIIADEPTGNVDPQMSYEIVDLLMRLNEAGTTVIMVTHEHSLVRCFDKRVIILDRGSVVSDGELNNLDQATAHINPASEIASDYSKGAEDYSVYSRSDADSAAVSDNEITEVMIADDFAEIIESQTVIEDISSGGADTLTDGGENID
jgi:cell division ATP-binding protein FtsE